MAMRKKPWKVNGAPLVDVRDRTALRDHNPAPPDVVEAAREIKENALLMLSLDYSPMAAYLFGKCYHQIQTTAIETMAVVLLRDGTTMLLYNPDFTVKLGETGALFVLMHEARHLMMRHLYSEPHLRGDPNWTLATEAGINHTVLARLKRPDMPTIEREVEDPKTGAKTTVLEPTGVNPRELHKEYKKNLEEQGLSPLDYEQFISTDYKCYAELSRMKQEKSNELASSGVCIHMPDGDPGDSDGNLPMDEDVASEISKGALENLMRTALAGGKRGEKSRSELLELGDRSEDSTDRVSKIWGSLGLSLLRGETPTARRIDWWKQWLTDALASKLQEGDRLLLPPKRTALNLMLHQDPMMMRRGDEEVKVVLIALDTSGSMSQEVVEYLTKLVGQTDGVEAHWVSFDGVVMPFVPGERVSGGGGTNFDNVVEYAEGRLEVNGRKFDITPDAVIMLTDGYAAPVRPAEPDKWIWLITEGGSDDWITAQNQPMDSHHIRTGDGA